MVAASIGKPDLVTNSLEDLNFVRGLIERWA
jgi:hypothetical protein